MGIAMISVMLYHAAIGKSFDFSFSFSDIFLWYGHWGVDVFLFLSGFGICYSLKRKKQSVFSFWRKRIQRIMPACLIVGWIHIALASSFSLNAETISQAIGLNVWYIRCILLYYALSPALAWYFSTINKRKALISILISSAIITCATQWIFENNIYSIKESVFYLFHGTIMFSISRFPAFVFGFFVADESRSEESFFRKKTYLIVAIIAFIAALIGHTPSLSRLIFGKELRFLAYTFLSLSIPVILWIIVNFLHFFPKFVNKFLVWIGTYSLEIFLIHCLIFRLIKELFIYNGNWLTYILLSFSTSFLAAYILNKTIYTLTKLFKHIISFSKN